MFTSKQRAYLRSLASNEPTIMQIGKSGIGENLIKTVSDALEAREVAEALAEATNAEVVGVIGKKIILYRQSEKNKRIEL